MEGRSIRDALSVRSTRVWQALQCIIGAPPDWFRRQRFTFPSEPPMDQLAEFATNHWILVTAFFVVLGLLIANLMSGAGGVTPQEAVRMINHEGAVVLDVRAKGEYEAGHIIDAIHIPAAEVVKSIESLKKRGEAPLIVYCGAGTQSGQTVRQLKQQGFDQVRLLKGGIAAWRNENFPVSST